MINFFKKYSIFGLLIMLLSPSCAFDDDYSRSKKNRSRYSADFDGKFRVAGRGFALRVKPSESMQAGIPKDKNVDFQSYEYVSRYNANNYRNYQSRSQIRENNGLTEIRKDDFELREVDYQESQLDYENPPIDRDNILQSGIYSGHFKIGQPYTAFGVDYVPQDYETFEEIGTASWYGADFHGKKTANGEVYNMGDLTAAHPTLPLPSLIKVTNLENGKSQILRVNDRGPFAKNRVIDVSEKAAELLGFKGRGTTQVRVELLREETDELLKKLKIKN